MAREQQAHSTVKQIESTIESVDCRETRKELLKILEKKNEEAFISNDTKKMVILRKQINGDW